MAPNVCSAPSTKVTAFSILNQTGKDCVPYYIAVHTCSLCSPLCSHVKVTANAVTYKPNQLCSHSVPVAKKNDLLNSFIEWHVQNQAILCLLQLLT